VAIALKVIADAFANLSFPAWTSMTGDVVPLAWRGRYFGSRNIMMGISNMISILIIGQLITHTRSPAGYQLALVAAFLVGSVSTFSYAHIREKEKPAVPLDMRSYSPAGLWASLRADSNFAVFCLYNAFWNFSLNVAGPFFNIYLVQDLHASAAMVGVTSLIASLTGLPAQRWFGQLSDRLGPRRVQLLTGLLIPILPISWVFTTNVWHVVPIQIGSGILWSGFNLASFNFLLALIPPEQRARFSALNQIAIALASAIGAAIGGVIAGQFGYHAVFILSGVGRFLSMFIFIRFVRQPQPAAGVMPVPPGAPSGD
jgi:MFS family permease